MAVYVEVIISASGVALAHQSLAIARPNFPAHSISAVASVAPGIVLGRTKVYLVESVHTFTAEQRIIEFAIPIFSAEKQTKSMFGIAVAAAVASPYPQACVDLEAITHIKWHSPI